MSWDAVTADPNFWLGAIVFGIVGFVLRGLIRPEAVAANESIILLALDKLGEGYGVSLLHEVSEIKLGRQPSLGWIYTYCDRLVKKGLIESREGERTAERGWRRKRYYRLTERGKAMVRLMHEAEKIEQIPSGNR